LEEKLYAERETKSLSCMDASKLFDLSFSLLMQIDNKKE